METIIVDESENQFILILRELELISKRLLTIEDTLNMNAYSKVQVPEQEIPKVKTRINSSLSLVQLLEKQSFEAKKLIHSAEDINAKAK